MARDGTYRGGRRPRAGERPAPLAEKIAKGTPAQVLEVPDFFPESELQEDALEGAAELTG